MATRLSLAKAEGCPEQESDAARAGAWRARTQNALAYVTRELIVAEVDAWTPKTPQPACSRQGATLA